jgi:hypothetical protein
MKKIFFCIVVVALCYYRFVFLYKETKTAIVSLKELSLKEYPENPSSLGKHYKRYAKRQLKITHLEKNFYNLEIFSSNPNNARINFKNIDLSLWIPKIPSYAKTSEDHEIVSLVEREWNRQQVLFFPGSSHLEITGGDDIEVKNISKVALARNCLNAGLWEVLLYMEEDGKNKLYYQGWFDFPKGIYKKIFEHNNKISYWKHFYRLEHWFDPAGKLISLDQLRQVSYTHSTKFHYNSKERIIIAGEQKNKIRTNKATNIHTWGDFFTEKNKISYAAFVPPGYYSHENTRETKYDLLSNFKKGTLRLVKVNNKSLHEIELEYQGQDQQIYKLIISGIDLQSLPKLSFDQYHKGFYMPMGIGVPPFYQSYSDLVRDPPHSKYYVSVLLDEKNRWIDHHSVGIDGPVLHKDKYDPKIFHLYLLSYERHTLVAHYVFSPYKSLTVSSKFMNQIKL